MQSGRRMITHTHTGEPGGQLDLFAGFDMPVREAPAKAKRRACTLRRVVAKVVQLTLDLRARVEDAADEWVERWVSRPVVHATVDAKSTRMPDTRAVASIFDMGYQVAAQEVLDGFMLQQPEPAQADTKPAKPAAFQDQAHTKVTREPGVIRCQRLHHTDTQEWQERETARRARQKPPKPPKAAKTMGAKLVELVGTADAT